MSNLYEQIEEEELKLQRHLRIIGNIKILRSKMPQMVCQEMRLYQLEEESALDPVDR